jgi:hypothetical protein
MTVELDQTFDLPFLVDTAQAIPFTFLVLYVEADRERIDLVDWSPGQALVDYISVNGEPACDIYIERGVERAVLAAGVYLDRPFSTEEYGKELLVVRCKATARSPGKSSLWASYEYGTPLQAPYAVGDFLVDLEVTAPPVTSDFRRGDVNEDSRCDISDAIGILGYLFQGFRAVRCIDAADVDDDGEVVLNDPLILLRSLFQGGAAIPERCLPDTTADDLPPCASASCHS